MVVTRYLSKETKHKISLAIKGRKLSAEHKAKIGEGNRGKVRTEAMKLHLHNVLVGYQTPDEVRAKISAKVSGKNHPLYGKHHSSKTKAKMSQIHKAIWRDPSKAKKYWESFHKKPNKAELKLLDILNQYFPNEWAYVGNGKLLIDSKCPDFANVNGKKQVIELFGDYWHRLENPQDRINTFQKYGYTTLVIYERELAIPTKLVAKIIAFQSGEEIPYGIIDRQLKLPLKYGGHRDYHGANNPNYGNRYSKETRAKIRANHCDTSGQKNPFYGKHHTKEAKDKMRLAWRERR